MFIEVKWDTEVDGTVYEPAAVNLPETITVPDHIVADEAEREDAITDWLSDTYGFCVFGWTRTYESQSARDAQARNYGSESYWSYLDKTARESRDYYLRKNNPDEASHMMTRSLVEALRGNDGI